MSAEPNVFEVVLAIDAMPPCPLCNKPILTPPKTDADQLMVFIAFGRAALAHDGCHPDRAKQTCLSG